MASISFQVCLDGVWERFKPDEDKVLKCAFLAGLTRARYAAHGVSYEFDFRHMTRREVGSNLVQDIRPPHRWRRPAGSIINVAFTERVEVPAEGPGSMVRVPHPAARGKFIEAVVPRTASAGQSMLVAFPEALADANAVVSAAERRASGCLPAAKQSTLLRVLAGALAFGGMAVAGAFAGEGLAEEGWTGATAEVSEAAAATHEFVGNAANGAGDCVMELF